jgi:hypothetical protein
MHAAVDSPGEGPLSATSRSDRFWPFAAGSDPGGSPAGLYVRLLGDPERVVEFDSEIPHGALGFV